MKTILKTALIAIIVTAIVLFIGSRVTVTKSPGFVQKEGPCGAPNDGCVTVIQFN